MRNSACGSGLEAFVFIVIAIVLLLRAVPWFVVLTRKFAEWRTKKS
jgi:hypothetical protein